MVENRKNIKTKYHNPAAHVPDYGRVLFFHPTIFYYKIVDKEQKMHYLTL